MPVCACGAVWEGRGQVQDILEDGASIPGLIKPDYSVRVRHGRCRNNPDYMWSLARA